jgi:hypothetical protein
MPLPFRLIVIAILVHCAVNLLKCDRAQLRLGNWTIEIYAGNSYAESNSHPATIRCFIFIFIAKW